GCTDYPSSTSRFQGNCLLGQLPSRPNRAHHSAPTGKPCSYRSRYGTSDQTISRAALILASEAWCRCPQGDDRMPKYMVQGCYTGEGLDGLLKEGGASRRQASKQAVEQLGGTLEAFYFAFGTDDFVILLDLPSDVDMAALALFAQATGTVKSRVTVLMAPEQVDEATKRAVKFRAPGQ